MITKKDLNDLQKKKLNLAACILQKTASLYDGKSTNMLSLWGGGVITHGVPKIKKCRIGITENAIKAKINERADDHLYRVTETVSFVINKSNCSHPRKRFLEFI